jgi:hypothetical protein
VKCGERGVFQTFVLMGTCVLSECMLLVSMVAVMLVHIVGDDSHVSSCFSELLFSAFSDRLTCQVSVCYSLLIRFSVVEFSWCCFLFFVEV